MRFILDRGLGEHSFDDLKKYFECFLGEPVDDARIVAMLRGFRRTGMRVEMDAANRKFRIEADSPDEVLRGILREYSGRKLSEALEAFRKVFGDFDEKRLVRILRTIRGVALESSGKIVPVARISRLDPDAIIRIF